MTAIKEQLSLLPDKPGVYLMKDGEQAIIYVGKAISLKNRVRQYFQSARNLTPKVQAMVSHIESFETIVTDSELEALILECNLIKKHRPKYNVLLRDDKTYPFIKVTLEEPFPRVIKTRRVLKDKGKYFGPYTNVGALNETLDMIHQLYPIRSCKKNIERMIANGERPCLNFHIKKCIGPCRGLVAKAEYDQMIQEIIQLLSGREGELAKKIREKMEQAATQMDFERAARYRDQLFALESTLEKQKVVTDQKVDQDVIALSENQAWFMAMVFFIREGKLIHREHFILDPNEEAGREEMLEAFIKQYYTGIDHIPREILVETALPEAGLIEAWLSEKRGSKVEIKVPQRGEKRRLLEMVQKNLATYIQQEAALATRGSRGKEEELRELEQLLQLDAYPQRIEAYDISNIQGVQSVGSMVVFEEGRPVYQDYRRFKIKTITGPNDYGSLEEMLHRRFKRGLEETEAMIQGELTLEKGKFLVFPDLIMVDGGQGQVTSVEKVLRALELDIPVCGMIKDDKHKTKGLIYQGQAIVLPKNAPLFRFIYQVQEEVHRFAITYHKTLRKKTMLQSELESIPGIGEARRKALFKHFGSMNAIRAASLEDLLQVKGMNRSSGEKLLQYFQQQAREESTDS